MIRQHHRHERGAVCADGLQLAGHGRASAGDEHLTRTCTSGVAFGVSRRAYTLHQPSRQERDADCSLIVDLTPNVSDITENAPAAEEAGADAISVINTLTGIAVDEQAQEDGWQTTRATLPTPAVRPVALRMVWQNAKRECIFRSSAWAGSRPTKGCGSVHALQRKGKS